MESADGFHGTDNHACPGAFYVGLNYIDARQTEFGDQIVHSSYRDIRDNLRIRPMLDETIACAAVSIGIENEPLFFIPDAFRVDDDAP